jgi:murein DD-endopeptidase MepM/ murein hydrolase activator NlpD
MNSFTQGGFNSLAGTMGKDLDKFMGGFGNISKLYQNVFKPTYQNASSFAPNKNSLSPSFSGGGDTSSFHPTTAYSNASQYSRFGADYSMGADWQTRYQALGLSDGTSTPVTGGYTGTGTAGSTGVGALDAHNNELNQAASAYGVPANLLKAIMNNESSGEWDRDGSRYTWLGERGYGIMPFMGLTDPVLQKYGYSHDQVAGNKQLQINIAAHLISDLAKENGGFDNAIKVYFMGPAALQGNVSDGSRMSNDYYKEASDLWHQWDGQSAGMSGQNSYQQQYGQGGTTAPSGTTAFSSIWGGGEAPISFEFNAGGGPDLYGYGTQYGMNGSGHTGVDVGVPLGTTLHAPMAGTVTCAGTGNGPGADGGGCAAFNDVMGGGNGRIEIQLDNGQVIILGHTSTSSVRPGQRVNAGDAVGTSGGMNGAHVHVEARVRDSSTGSGWRIVDPRSVLGGNFSGTMGAGAPTTSAGSGNPFKFFFSNRMPYSNARAFR